MGIHHRGAYIPVSEPFMNCPDVAVVFEEMRGEGMARLMEVAVGGGGGRAADLGFPETLSNEADDVLLGLEGAGDSQERGAVLARTAC